MRAMATTYRPRWGMVLAAASAALQANLASAATKDPFRVIDPQNWVNPDDMTWEDFVAPPGTNWGDPSVTGSERNFNIALVVVDYPDMEFAVTQEARSTIFGNPQPSASELARDEVASFYRDLLNLPGDLNRGRTLHEYWMEDSAGRFGVDLTAFGAYEMPSRSWQYGIDDRFNPGGCPQGGDLGPCNLNIRTDALGAWRADVGNETADEYELVFILSAGQDESSTWQEFGQMKWLEPEDVDDAFGPPGSGNGNGTNGTSNNYAATRYVDWTSWAAAATLWPNAGSGSSTQAESSGMGVYAHELSHLLFIADNYNNPYSDPPQRAYTGPWSMMSRGSFNGPGGPHSRWQIPALQGGSVGSLHTMRDKLQLGLADEATDVVRVNRGALAESGAVLVAQLTARAVDPGSLGSNGGNGLMGVRIVLDGEGDLEPDCDPESTPFCDGGPFDYYELEVVDRMGADSFQPDAGVMISKSKELDNTLPFQWTIDANPQDIRLVDFVLPNGTEQYVTVGDYRQLADALFHAGTRSGSEFEFEDEHNALHFYILDIHRSHAGVLSYTVGVRSLESEVGADYGVDVLSGVVEDSKNGTTPTGLGVTCSFEVANTGSLPDGGSEGDEHLAYDVFRLSAEVDAGGWRVEVPNAIKAVKFGETEIVGVAVGAETDADEEAVVVLTVVSELGGAEASGECRVSKA